MKSAQFKTLINTTFSKKPLLTVVKFSLGPGVLCILTWIGWSLHANLTAMSFVFLLLVLYTAYKQGLWESSTISFLAVAALDYFFTPPMFHFEMDNPQDWFALAVFEITAIMLSRISAHELHTAQDAKLHRQGLVQLYALSQNLILIDMHQALGPQLLVLIKRIFSVPAVAIFDAYRGHQNRLGDWSEEDFDLARECYLSGKTDDEKGKSAVKRLLVAGDINVGALVVRGSMTPFVADALASVSATALHRYQSFEKEERAENESRSERLRAAVLDALAHELKTPLTAIQMASSGLLELGQLNPRQNELVTLIDGEISRLNHLCTKLLLTAKLDAGQVGLKWENTNMAQVVEAVLHDPSRCLEADRVSVNIEDPALTVKADRGLLSMIITQYLDNARKYARPDTPILIHARKSNTEVLLSVHNYGSTIRIEDRERIFDRFYRSAQSANAVEGTGIGLSAVRKAAEAHHGHVWVVSEEKSGTTFYLSLPVNSRDELIA